MSTGWKLMLFWTLGFPAILTSLRILTDVFTIEEIIWVDYTAVFLGAAVAGLLFAGPLRILMEKAKEE
ncbi:hypothetical protein ACFOGI_09440 [Virgibacillus xinjiangensis]|uniref:Uncharacterized protein n=1 Tax=Virgibacillus xinjiangensis TaxID=393090 RepID=A0ABV7CVV7_9BACI